MKATTQHTVIQRGDISYPCSTYAGTALLNLCNRVGIASKTIYTEHATEQGTEVERAIEVDLQELTCFKIVQDMEMHPLKTISEIVAHYYEGAYTFGEIPSHAWYMTR